MKRMTMGRLLKTLLYSLVTIVILGGCSDQDEAVEWIFFSEITSDAGEEVEEKFKDMEGDSFTMHFYAAVYERLIGEIASHNGDILFVEADMLTPATFDIEGLLPLNSAVEKGKEIPEEYKGFDPDTGEKNIYALPIDENSVLLKHFGVSLDKPLVALVPIYSEQHEVSIEALKQLSKLSGK